MSKNTYDIEISVQEYEFHKRFWWMLSSIIDQKPSNGNPVPSIIIKIDTHTSDRWKDLRSRMMVTFMDLLNIRVQEYNSEIFGKRGVVRNDTIETTKAKWIFFSDADMVFHPEFFSDLWANHTKKWENKGVVLTAPRWSTDIPKAYEIVDDEDYSNYAIEESFDKANSIVTGYSGGGRAPGAGYFQYVETQYMKDNDIKYPYANSERSLFNKRGNKFNSDIIFRRQFNKVVKISKSRRKNDNLDILPPIIHLNHWRKGNQEWIDVCR